MKDELQHALDEVDKHRRNDDGSYESMAKLCKALQVAKRIAGAARVELFVKQTEEKT